ncbi:AAA family ATPase [Neobacillus sp. D3-1R]|uniref:AAA family ATPase n=1 Tax=Neobacillus sp. D3-1R TaxID=3445778 RepID=UPI003FA064B6
MIIMINGAFGVGKTTVSESLLKEIDNSMLYDPEEVGYMLRTIITKEVMKEAEQTGDFQDLELWKVFTVKVAESLLETYNKTLIVPMTIYKKENFEYILEGFKQIDPQTYHFCLLGHEETIYERLRKRGEEEGNWCFQQTQKCVTAFKDPGFGEFIHTDEMNVEEIVKTILGTVSQKSTK